MQHRYNTSLEKIIRVEIWYADLVSRYSRTWILTARTFFERGQKTQKCVH